LIFYSVKEIAAMLLAAMALDLLIGDPRRLVHPVVVIGRWIRLWERRLLDVPQNRATAAANRSAAAANRSAAGANRSVASAKPTAGAARSLRLKGIVLAAVTVAASFALMWLVLYAAQRIHPWLGYAVNVWFISTTIAIKGLKDAAYLVYGALESGRLDAARAYAGQIVGRDTERLDEPETVRAAVETVAENIVDAVVSPLFYAFLGAAPLAMLYRATNTLDSMVGYRNERYLHFGWASARWDDAMNWLPARLTGLLLVVVAFAGRGWSARRAYRAVRAFARLHPSPNSGIPESAVAGALGIELGGVNTYGGIVSERARMGWPLREKERRDIVSAVRMLYGTSYLIAGGLMCVLLVRL
jgi:adenosylcobinamide-phosphate synthase